MDLGILRFGKPLSVEASLITTLLSPKLGCQGLSALYIVLSSFELVYLCIIDFWKSWPLAWLAYSETCLQPDTVGQIEYSMLLFSLQFILMLWKLWFQQTEADNWKDCLKIHQLGIVLQTCGKCMSTSSKINNASHEFIRLYKHLLDAHKSYAFLFCIMTLGDKSWDLSWTETSLVYCVYFWFSNFLIAYAKNMGFSFSHNRINPS